MPAAAYCTPFIAQPRTFPCADSADALMTTPGAECPDAVVLYRALAGVLSQYNRRQKLVSDLLAATRDAAAHEEALEAALE